MSQYNNSYDVSRVNIAASQHTPGPWRVGDAGHTIFGPKESDGRLPQRIGEVCAVREDYLANARLIAAAPELLASLKNLLANTERPCTHPVGAPHSVARIQWEHDKRVYDEAMMVIERAAIAKVQP
jgi:hypothetical protein